MSGLISIFKSSKDDCYVVPNLMKVNGGSATIFARTSSWACSYSISLSGKIVSLTAQGNGSYYCGARCCVYGAL